MRSGMLLLALSVVLASIAGCTEVRIDGDARVFQSSATGSIIRMVIGVAVLGLGVVSLLGSVLPDRKPRHRPATADEKLSPLHRLGLAVFGGAMCLVGLSLSLMPLLFPSKLHVTVHPDRVAMASTYSQTGGREVVIPFADLASVELRDEPNLVGKVETFLVFSFHGGNARKIPASNNERAAFETIRRSLAEYQAQPEVASLPRVGETPPTPAPTTLQPAPEATAGVSMPPPAFAVPPLPTPSLTPASPATAAPGGQTEALPAAETYRLKRYPITIPLPEGHSLVPPAASVATGTKLGSCYAGRWETVTVVAVNEDGTLSCNWDTWPAFTYKMVREDLIIDEDLIVEAN